MGTELVYPIANLRDLGSTRPERGRVGQGRSGNVHCRHVDGGPRGGQKSRQPRNGRSVPVAPKQGGARIPARTELARGTDRARNVPAQRRKSANFARTGAVLL